MIRRMVDSEAMAVARLHAEAINQGFLAKLGPRFLRQVYLGVAHDAESRVFVAVAEDKVLGFCAYSRDVGAMYRRILCRRGVFLALACLPRALRPSVIREVLDTLRYPAKQSAKELPRGEILSIAVDSSTRGSGIGGELLDEAIEQSRRDGLTAIKVLAGAALKGANRFYQANGFDCVDQVIQHGEPLNVYVRRL